jgi:hypothetical protein
LVDEEVIETVKGGFISEGFFQIGSILKKNMQNHSLFLNFSTQIKKFMDAGTLLGFWN